MLSQRLKFLSRAIPNYQRRIDVADAECKQLPPISTAGAECKREAERRWLNRECYREELIGLLAQLDGYKNAISEQSRHAANIHALIKDARAHPNKGYLVHLPSLAAGTNIGDSTHFDYYDGSKCPLFQSMEADFRAAYHELFRQMKCLSGADHLDIWDTWSATANSAREVTEGLFTPTYVKRTIMCEYKGDVSLDYFPFDDESLTEPDRCKFEYAPYGVERERTFFDDDLWVEVNGCLEAVLDLPVFSCFIVGIK